MTKTTAYQIERKLIGGERWELIDSEHASLYGAQQRAKDWKKSQNTRRFRIVRVETTTEVLGEVEA